MFFEIYDRVVALAEKYSGKAKKVTPSEFTNIIRRQFAGADFLFRTVKDPAVELDMIVIAGSYDPMSDSLGDPSIEICLCYNPDQKYYFTQLIDWEKLCFDFAECVCHEGIHQLQYRKHRSQKEFTNKLEDLDPAYDPDYLSNDLEIDAYGFSIAAESVVYGQHFTQCSMYKVYSDTFDNQPTIMAKLEEQILKYLKYLEITYEKSSTRVATRIRYR